MGMVPPSLLPLLRREAQPKEEHPLQEEWDAVKSQAQKRGLLHNDGTFAIPPDGPSGIFPVMCGDPSVLVPPPGGGHSYG